MLVFTSKIQLKGCDTIFLIFLDHLIKSMIPWLYQNLNWQKNNIQQVRTCWFFFFFGEFSLVHKGTVYTLISIFNIFNIYFENGQYCKGFNDIVNEIISSASKHSNSLLSLKNLKKDSSMSECSDCWENSEQ